MRLIAVGQDGVDVPPKLRVDTEGSHERRLTPDLQHEGRFRCRHPNVRLRRDPLSDLFSLRESLAQRLQREFRRAGLSRWHWVVEWQRRGTPHLHLAVYAPPGWYRR